MKYLKFTYVDSVTKIPVNKEPATNGPCFPDVEGLQFVFALESQYPTEVPEFFGTCPDDSNTNIEGVFQEFSEEDFNHLWQDELQARIPKVVSMRQARLALLQAELLDDVELSITSIAGSEGKAAKIEWEYATEVNRYSNLVNYLKQVLSLTDLDIDNLFITASKL